MAVLAAASSQGCGATPRAGMSEAPLVTRELIPRAAPVPSPTVTEPGDATMATAGLDAARALLFELLLAIRDEDEPGIRRLLAEETHSVHAFRLAPQGSGPRSAQRVLGASRRDVVVQRMLAARRVSRLSAEDPLDAWVDPRGVEVVPASVFFTAGVPAGLSPGDLVVRFAVSPDAERALLSLAVRGRGLLVVRLQPASALVVGL